MRGQRKVEGVFPPPHGAVQSGFAGFGSSAEGGGPDEAAKTADESLSREMLLVLGGGGGGRGVRGCLGWSLPATLWFKFSTFPRPS